jgi:hypothetical protein
MWADARHRLQSARLLAASSWVFEADFSRILEIPLLPPGNKMYQTRIQREDGQLEVERWVKYKLVDGLDKPRIAGKKETQPSLS